jgi:hypothetical protein
VQFGQARRKSIRFHLQTEVFFSWRDEDGKPQQGQGSVRDISEEGTFVFAAICPPVGTTVGLRMNLEGLSNAKESIPIEYQGQVVRVERPNDETANGFAVQRRSS